MKERIIIFCQAPADIRYALELYENNKELSEITIYVINVHNVYLFLKSLDLYYVVIEFIPYSGRFSMRNPISILLERIRLQLLWSNFFSNIINSKVYFFSIYEDWLTAFFVKNLAYKNDVYYLDYYDFSANIFDRRTESMNSHIKKVLYFLLTGVSFKFQVIEKLPEFDFTQYNIKQKKYILGNVDLSKYMFNVHGSHSNNNKVFVFISPCEDSIFQKDSYDLIQFEILSLFKNKGWDIYVKGHPRLGVPANIDNLVDVEVPSFIPAEFLNLTDFSLICGGITSSLAAFSENYNTFSFLNLFNYIDISHKNSYKLFLDKLSNNRLKYFHTFNDITDEILKI